MDRLFYGIGIFLTLAGLSLVDYRLSMIVCGVVFVAFGLIFDFLPGKADD